MNNDININDTVIEDLDPDFKGFDGAEGVDNDEDQ